MVARDGRSTYLAAAVGPLRSETASYNHLRASIDADPVLRGRVLIGGLTAVAAQDSAQATKDLTASEEIGIPVLLLLLGLVLSGALVVAVPVIGALVTVAVSLLGMAAVGLFRPLSVFSLDLVVALGLGLSIDFSLLGVGRFRQELARAGSPAQAARRTLATAGRTTAFSAVTICAALGSLLVFPEREISSLAVAGMLATAGALGFSLLVLPPLLAWLGPRVATRSVGRGSKRSARRWTNFTERVMARPVIWAAGAVVLLGVLAFPLVGVAFTGYSASELPASLPAVQVQAALSHSFAGASAWPIEIVMEAPPNDPSQRERCPGISSTRESRATPTSPISTPPTAPRSSSPPNATPPSPSTRSSATPPNCPSPSTPPTATAKPWPPSPTSTS